MGKQKGRRGGIKTMNLWLRTLITYVIAHFKPRTEVMDVTCLRRRVLPTDLDIAMHMNNGRYLTIADLGRWDMIIRTGFWPKMRRKGWHPVVGASKIWHRRSLLLLQPFDLTTRILFWDEKWTYLEHRFEGVGKNENTLYCKIVVKTLFLKGREKIPSADLVEAFGYHGQSPKIDEDLIRSLG